MSSGDSIHVNQTASDSSGVTQIGVQYTGDVHHHYAPGTEPKRTAVTLDLGLEQVDVSKLIALIAGLTQAGVQDINLVGVRLGSLIVTLDMPADAAYTLGRLALTRPELFAEFRLHSIHIDLPPPSGAAVAGRPGRPRPRRARGNPLETWIKRLVLLTGFVVAIAAIVILIWLIQNPPASPPAAVPCLLASTRGAQPVYGEPSTRTQPIAEFGEEPGLEVTGMLAGGGWWRVLLEDGREGWVIDRAIFLSGPCADLPQVEPGGGEACSAVIVWPTRLGGRVYEGPSPNFAPIGTLPEGTPVLIRERSEDFTWWLVFSEEFDLEGWMPATSLALQGNCEAIPAIPPG